MPARLRRGQYLIMWQDMVLYWAWRGKTPNEVLPPTPTNKRIEYAKIFVGRYLNGPEKGNPVYMNLAVTVFDDQVQKKINRDELEWLMHNAKVRGPL